MFRVEIHIDGITFHRLFDNADAAHRAAKEARRDGARAVFIKQRINDQYVEIGMK